MEIDDKQQHEGPTVKHIEHVRHEYDKGAHCRWFFTYDDADDEEERDDT